MEKYGHWSPDAGEYIITTPDTPRMMENFLFNDRYFAMVLQNGNGFSRYVDPSGHNTTIIEGTNEPGFCTNTRLIYLRDDEAGVSWNVGFHPVCRTMQSFECQHGIGRTTIVNLTDGIRATWRLFVPPGEEPLELWTLLIENIGQAKRKLSLFAFVELSLLTTAALYGHASYLHSCLLAEANGIAVRKAAMNLPHPYFGAVFLSSLPSVSRDARWDAFAGGFRTLANPVALEKGSCSGAVSSRDRVAGVLHCRLDLTPGSLVRGDFLVAAVDVEQVEEEALGYEGKYLNDRGATVDEAFARLQEETEARLGRNTFSTPEQGFDVLFGRWLPQLVEFGATHCRCGIFGFRDIVQQAQGVVMLGRRAKSRARLTQALSFQYPTGYAVRSFPVVHEDSRMKYADSAFWLVCAVTEYLKETGDLGFLDERLPFFGQQGEATVWNHLELALEALGRERGPHGLCLIHEGDWNDSLTHVGRRGIGESVMLSESYCYACLLLEELATRLGKDATAASYRSRYEQMRESIVTHCWDGAWFVRAFDDQGNAIGSRNNDEGRIFLNAQSWAMLARLVPESKLGVVLDSVRRHLYTPYGYLLHHPTYTVRRENIGRLTCLEPGCSENASVYTHGNAFFALALLQIGLADEALDVLRRIAPNNPENPSSAILPYQFVNAYAGPDHRYEPGRAQYGWMTGSGSWLYLAIIDYLFGARKGYDGLRIKPCLPSRWPVASLRRTFRGSVYEISYRRAGDGKDLRSLTVDGTEYNPEEPLPLADGKSFTVQVDLE